MEEHHEHAEHLARVRGSPSSERLEQSFRSKSASSRDHQATGMSSSHLRLASNTITDRGSTAKQSKAISGLERRIQQKASAL